jgi:hypothetical protein
MSDKSNTQRARKATAEAIAASRRIGELAAAVTHGLETSSDGIPVETPADEDNSTVTAIAEAIAIARTRTGNRAR